MPTTGLRQTSETEVSTPSTKDDVFGIVNLFLWSDSHIRSYSGEIVNFLRLRFQCRPEIPYVYSYTLDVNTVMISVRREEYPVTRTLRYMSLTSTKVVYMKNFSE